MTPVLRGTFRSAPSTRDRTPTRGKWALAALLAIAFVVALDGGLHAQQPPDLVVIVNEKVLATALSADELASIFTRATRSWKDGDIVIPLNLRPGTAERTEFDRTVLKMSPERSAQFWMDRQVRGEEPAPKAIARAEIMVRLVATARGAIGYVPADKVDATVRIVARIRNGRVGAP
jgi:hypothetical protein